MFFLFSLGALKSDLGRELGVELLGYVVGLCLSILFVDAQLNHDKTGHCYAYRVALFVHHFLCSMVWCTQQ